MNFFETPKNNKGFGLTEVAIAIAIMAIAGLGVAKLSGMVNQNSMQLKAIRAAMTARSQIEAALKNPTAWAQTVKNNPSFKCASLTPGCDLSAASGGYYNFVLYGSQANEKVSYDSADGTSRYSIHGGHCPTGLDNPSTTCPIKYQAQWKPVCQTYPCLNPTLEIKVQLVTEFASQNIPLNTKNYDYSTVRGISEDTIQSACLILNGTYNSLTRTCLPKYSGRTCASLGKPTEIVTGVHADGSIDCSPLYRGKCDATTQMMTGIDANANALCSGKVQPATCPKNCVGAFGNCSATCGGGTRTFAISVPAANGGLACPFAAGATQACNTQACPANCVGSWSACSQSCGGGSMTFTVTTPAVNGGSACLANNGDTQVCNTQACAVPVACNGNWSACNPLTGTQNFTVTQAPQNGGAACPASPKNCAVDCVGNWSDCNAGSKVYAWAIPPRNGGASCSYANGLASSCPMPPSKGTWSCGELYGNNEVSCSSRPNLCTTYAAESSAWLNQIDGKSCDPALEDSVFFGAGCTDCSSNGIVNGGIQCRCVTP